MQQCGQAGRLNFASGNDERAKENGHGDDGNGIQLGQPGDDDGGELFANQVKNLPGMQRYGGSQFYPLAQRYPDQWNVFMNKPPSDCGEDQCQTMAFNPHPIEPPQVIDGVMTGFLVQLQVTDDVILSATDSPWLTFKFGSEADDQVTFSPDKTGLFLFDFDRPVSIDEMAETCAMICNVSQAPSSLLKDGVLNKAALLDIALAIVYEGNKG